MNKKLISKCCHSEVSESVYFTCLKCGQVCEVIEIEEPQPIQKEKEVKPKSHSEEKQLLFEYEKWEKYYNELRTCHNIIKMLQNKNNCPFWFGEKEKLPKRYAELLLKVSDALYDAEAYTNKKFN